MVRLSDLAQAERDHLINLPCLLFDTQPWAEGPRFRSDMSRSFRQRVSKGVTIDRSLAAMRIITSSTGIPRQTKSLRARYRSISTGVVFNKTSMSFSRWNAEKKWPRTAKSDRSPILAIPSWVRRIRNKWSRSSVKSPVFYRKIRLMRSYWPRSDPTVPAP